MRLEQRLLVGEARVCGCVAWEHGHSPCLELTGSFSVDIPGQIHAEERRHPFRLDRFRRSGPFVKGPCLDLFFVLTACLIELAKVVELEFVPPDRARRGETKLLLRRRLPHHVPNQELTLVPLQVDNALDGAEAHYSGALGT